MELTRRQKNEIYREVEAAGLDPAACELKIEDYVSVTHRPSQSHIEIFEDKSDRSNRFTARGRAGTDPVQIFGMRMTWDQVTESVTIWAGGVMEYETTTDLWEELRRSKEALVGIQGQADDNSPFTAGEQALISARINEIKDYVRTTYELTGEKLFLMESRLDTLADDSRRFGRKDWMNSALGAAFGLVLQDVVPLHGATHIVVMVITGLGHMFGIGGMPPSLPPG